MSASPCSRHTFRLICDAYSQIFSSLKAQKMEQRGKLPLKYSTKDPICFEDLQTSRSTASLHLYFTFICDSSCGAHRDAANPERKAGQAAGLMAAIGAKLCHLPTAGASTMNSAVCLHIFIFRGRAGKTALNAHSYEREWLPTRLRRWSQIGDERDEGVML